jgi:tetratricopeptide (TPR) repeat protein
LRGRAKDSGRSLTTSVVADILLVMRCRPTIALTVFSAVFSVSFPALAQHHELGKVSFPTSCSTAVQADFEAGVAMLHSYWFNYAGKQFRAVLEKDPGCAMAYWGIALDLLGNTLSSPPPPQSARAAWDLLEKARGIEVKTERERLWLDAIRAYFRNHDTVTVEQRLTAYNEAMRRLSERFPEDFEAQVYYALTLQASAPKSDLTYANQYKSAEMLERLYTQQPQHPGITHYLIHAYDFAPFADKGIPAARRYASIAPAVPHARHMPAHIYSMVGMWQDSITSNMSALEIQPDYYHAADFTVYAHLQLAQDAAAAKMIEKALATPERGDRPATLANYTAKTAMAARYALERADWKGAATLTITPTEYPMADSLTHFTRGFGMARLGDHAGAKREIDAMQRLRAAMEKAGDAYWADRTQEQILAVSAWVALGEGAKDRAVDLMRMAADGEDASIKHVAMENRLYPMRELLADLLLEAGRASAAAAEYTRALKQTPNRYRGLLGAARAAEAAGNATDARAYYTRVIELSQHADGVRPELQGARAYLERR